MEPVNGFIERHPSLKILALAFLILIGVVLVADGLGQHLSKGYVYCSMAFSLGVELLNMRYRRRAPAAGRPCAATCWRDWRSPALVVLLSLTAVFGMVRLGGDPVLLFLPMDIQAKDVNEFRQRLGFNDPAARAVRPLHGGRRCAANFGESLRYRRDAFGLVLERLPATLLLAGAALVLTLLVAVPARRASPRCAAARWWTTSARWPPCSARPCPASGSGSC